MVNKENLAKIKELYSIPEGLKTRVTPRWIRKAMWNEITVDFIKEDRAFELNKNEYVVLTFPDRWSVPFDDTWEQEDPLFDDGSNTFTKLFDRRNTPQDTRR